jgi:hypothetical protein
MHIYDESTSRRTIWSVQINWSRELTFSERQIGFIAENVAEARGVYCIYAKDRKFRFSSPDWRTDRWSRVIYVGSGWLNHRLCAHLTQRRNDLLAEYLDQYQLAFRCDRIIDTEVIDWPRTVEAHLLQEFETKFGGLPCANRRREAIPDLSLDLFILNQNHFNFLARG